jgi:hypothetical protein
MRQVTGFATSLALMLALFFLASGAEVTGNDKPRPLLLTHYMPWFESKVANGAWGWHWTMGHFDPERSNPEGRRDIASHFYPLIGPYDSADPDVREYHTLLMTVAGIDGVVVDWYGVVDFNDYAMIHRRTSSLFESLKQVGMRFAICYEDRALKAMVERGRLTPEQAVEQGRMDLRYCADTWFRDSAYVRWDSKPLLLVFGPEYLNPKQWESVLSDLRPSAAFLTLHERRPPAKGSYAWPPMWASKHGVLDPKALDDYLDGFSKQDGLKIEAAFPGFHDIYKEAGVRPSYGYLDSRDGETFRHTLERAIASGCPYVQIATWNDFGEGTCIEPSREYGFRYLETVQDARRRIADGPFPYRPADLRLPIRIYGLRKIIRSSAHERKAIDAIVTDLFAGEVSRASKLLDELEKAARKSSPHSS